GLLSIANRIEPLSDNVATSGHQAHRESLPLNGRTVLQRTHLPPPPVEPPRLTHHRPSPHPDPTPADARAGARTLSRLGGAAQPRWEECSFALVGEAGAGRSHRARRRVGRAARSVVSSSAWEGIACSVSASTPSLPVARCGAIAFTAGRPLAAPMQGSGSIA